MEGKASLKDFISPDTFDIPFLSFLLLLDIIPGLAMFILAIGLVSKELDRALLAPSFEASKFIILFVSRVKYY